MKFRLQRCENKGFLQQMESYPTTVARKLTLETHWGRGDGAFAAAGHRQPGRVEAGPRPGQGGGDGVAGSNSPGKRLKQPKMAQNGPYTTIGIGDSLNDLTMLENVDYPVLVQKPGGHYDEAINLKNLMRAPGAGPDGWREAVMELLKKLGGGISSDRDSDEQE